MATPPTVRVMIYLGGKGYAVTMNASTGDTISDTEIPWLPGVSFTGELQETPSGLKYVELLEGTGPTPPSPSTTVKVHYTGYLVDGTKFDSSVDRGQPADFPLDRVVKGWGEGVGSMKVGGKRKLIIPASLGYGERGGGPIPPNATLVFDVELVEIVAAPPKADPVGVAPTRPVSGVK
ncbi:MAG: FKBP-type peptidyl-prolyl cis-trans isomerase [Phycisphaerales bacterium]|nr:FKBP-type peptidyl-prolyl cis-trans isomerase [Phycisphaerales bacterium]